MASVKRRELPSGAVRWDVRYRPPGDHRERMKSFAMEREAKSYRAAVEHEIDRGVHVDPRRQEVTVADWCDEWLKGKTNLAPKTRDRYEGILSAQVRPKWAKVKLKNLRHSQVQAWLACLPLAPASVRKVHGVLSQAMAYAVKDGRLGTNPAAGVSLPRVAESERLFLSHEQVDELADRCGDDYRLLVLFLAYTGLRWGEMASLRVKRLDFRRQRATIRESVTPIKGVMTFGPTKGHESRDVPIPGTSSTSLSSSSRARRLTTSCSSGSGGAPMRSQTFQRAALTVAAEAMGISGFTPHMLRHTAASLAIASGADVKVVQTMLGQVGDHDARPLRPPVRRPARRRRGRHGSGARTGTGAGVGDDDKLIRCRGASGHSSTGVDSVPVV
ncbi:MAG: site-specific integrase [Micropruina sp.]|nr:site-specific integrase [Micropruina sp.]